MTLVGRSASKTPSHHSPSSLHSLSSPISSKPLSSLSPRRLYLVLYNSISFLLWLTILVIALHHVITTTSKTHSFTTALTTLHTAVYPLLLVTESLALFECLHSLTRITNSPFLSTFIQTFQRNLVLWGVTWPVPSTRAQPAFAMMVLAWSLAEVIRYPFYAFTVAAPERLPHWLIKLRYSMFMPLYPVGMLAELVCMLHALPILQREDIWTLHLPNTWNFSFDWVYYVCFDALLYVPGAPYMYMHMMKQRKKVFQQFREHDAFSKKAQ